MEPVFVASSYSSTKLDYTYGCAILSEVYVFKAYLGFKWVTVYWWVCNNKSVQCLLALFTESLGYTTVMGGATLSVAFVC